jgi:tripartite ATP-independent transporter DctP family solute receptor
VFTGSGQAQRLSRSGSYETPLLPDRRTFLRTVGALPLVAAGCRAAARPEFDFKLASNVAASHPLNVRNQQAADRIAVASGGRLSVRLFPGGQLGSDSDLLSQLRSGAIEMITQSGLIVSTLVPAAAISGIGFAFASSDQAFAALDGDLGALIRMEIGRAGLLALPRVFDSGFRQITTTARAIETPADLKGLKIRVPIGPLWTSMFRALGASPTSINFSELYSALQTRVVDAEENPLVIISNAKLFEVQAYCSLTNHMWDGFWLIANEGAMQRLPPDLRDLLTREFARAAAEQRADLAALNSTIRGALTGTGMRFVDVDPLPFRQALRAAGFYTEWRQRLGDSAWRTLAAHADGLA